MPTPNILRRLHLDWPLLGKELLEQAARKQMYMVRVAYALVLFGAFCFYYMRHLAEGPVLTLGRGMGPFNFLVMAQLVAIYLFLPPLVAGALAQEKERDTLGLLFLTSLTPWELILQKYVGRLIPMLTLLFLSLPLLAVAYSLGGVSAGMLYSSAMTLFLTCLWVGALALECSAHEATTLQSLVRCWGICLGVTLFCLLGPIPFWASFPLTYGATPSRLFLLVPVFFKAFVYLLLTWLFLARAKQILEQRAFIQRRNPFGHQFKQLDQYWKDLRKLLRAISRKRDREAYADAEQVVQRGLGAAGDRHGWSLGGFLLAKMQVPNLLAFAIIFGSIVLVVFIANVMLDPKSGGAFSVVVGGLWILALLTVPIQSANAVASERMSERLDPILTTPLTASEILGKWLSPVRRWIQFLVRPLIVVIVVEAIIKWKTLDLKNPRWMNLALYLGISLLTVWIYPALVRWLCLWIGLRIRNQIRALMTSLLVVVGWCVLPLVASSYLVETGLLPEGLNEPLRFVSPVIVISTAEGIGWRATSLAVTSDLAVMALIQIGLAAVLMRTVRTICLTHADRYLGRI
jgi:ABC-type transport system involved in multi-copper enzyme maturation permease subunit